MEQETNINEYIEGRNAVIEALRAGRAIDNIYIAKGEVDQTLGHIAAKARGQGVVVVETDRRKLDQMSQTRAPSPLAWRPDFPGAPREAH